VTLDDLDPGRGVVDPGGASDGRGLLRRPTQAGGAGIFAGSDARMREVRFGAGLICVVSVRRN
jgi:hypothetical protein